MKQTRENNDVFKLVTIKMNISRQRVHFYLVHTSFYVRQQIIGEPKHASTRAIVIAQRRERRKRPAHGREIPSGHRLVAGMCLQQWGTRACNYCYLGRVAATRRTNRAASHYGVTETK